MKDRGFWDFYDLLAIFLQVAWFCFWFAER